MRGELIGVWTETLREIWTELSNHEKVPDDLFCELYREIETTFKTRLTIEQLADIVDDPIQSQQEFEKIKSEKISSEWAMVNFFEKTYEILADFDVEGLQSKYFNLLLIFIEKFSLRYELRPPCILHPTISGIFTSLIRELKTAVSQDNHLNTLMQDFEDAICDLRINHSETRIKTCIHKQIMLLEALGSKHTGKNGQTLGSICNKDIFPHSSLQQGLSQIYGFASNYPGIRHGGNPDSVNKEIEMNDMVAISIILSGFIPYLTNQISADVIYWRS